MEHDRRYVYFKLYKSISEIAVVWDQFLPPDNQLQSTRLKILEDAGMQDISFNYLLFFNAADEMKGMAYLQMVSFKRRHYNSPFQHSILVKLEEAIFSSNFQLVSCGNLLCVDSPGIFYDRDKTNLKEILPLIEKYFYQLNPSPHVILLKDWKYPDANEWLQRNKFQRWEGDLTMKLPINPQWKTFTGYINSLRHKYAQRVRKCRKQLGNVNRKELTMDEINLYQNEIQNLYLNVVNNQSIKLVITTGKYFLEMKKTYRERFRIHGYFMENKLVAFSSQIVHPDELELHFIGLDYKANESSWLYFNILYDAIEDAITLKKSELELGRTAQEAKSKVGAHPVYFENYYYSKGIITNALIRLLKYSFNKRNPVLKMKKVNKELFKNN